MSILQKVYPWFLGFLVAASALAGLLLWARAADDPGVEVLLPTPTAPARIQVYISGAVAHPGVITLQEGDRLADAVAAAGGPIQEADLAAVNLALRLKDEDHFHIPMVGAEEGPGPLASAGDDKGLLDINTATAAQLEALPGIGPVKAQAIVEQRQQVGRFTSIQELLQVSGIGPKTLEGIQELITAR